MQLQVGVVVGGGVLVDGEQDRSTLQVRDVCVCVSLATGAAYGGVRRLWLANKTVQHC
jgi:hypothetical protein